MAMILRFSRFNGCLMIYMCSLLLCMAMCLCSQSLFSPSTSQQLIRILRANDFNPMHYFTPMGIDRSAAYELIWILAAINLNFNITIGKRDNLIKPIPLASPSRCSSTPPPPPSLPVFAIPSPRANVQTI